MPIFRDYFDTAPALEVEKRLSDLFAGAPARLTDGLHPDTEGHATIFRSLWESLTGSRPKRRTGSVQRSP